MQQPDDVKCCQEVCDLPGPVRIHGPHGAKQFCEEHASAYEGLMRFMGCSTIRLAAEPPAPDEPSKHQNAELFHNHAFRSKRSTQIGD